MEIVVRCIPIGNGGQSRDWLGLLFLPALLPAALGSCVSLVNPYITEERRSAVASDGNPFPELRQAADNAEKLRKTALQYRNEHVVTRSLLGYAVFGAAAAGGVAALYDAPRGLVLGLGLGAVGGYTAGSLFVGADKVAIYTAGARALRCVVAAADAATSAANALSRLTASPSAEPPGGIYWKQDDELRQLLQLDVDWGDGEFALASQARDEYAAALSNLSAFITLDPTFANDANEAADLVVETMNQRLAAVQPDLDAVLRAAEQIGGLGVAYQKRVTPPDAPLKGLRVARSPSVQEKERLAILTDRVNTAAAEIDRRIIAATNRMGQMGTLCVFDLPTAAPLSISQNEVTLGKGQTVTLVASGGKLPLTYVWQGDMPSRDQIEVLLSGREIFLVGKDDLPSERTFRLLIRDSLPAPSEVEIEVTTPAAST